METGKDGDREEGGRGDIQLFSDVDLQVLLWHLGTRCFLYSEFWAFLRKVPWAIAPVGRCPGRKHCDVSAAKMEGYSHAEGVDED